MGLDTSARIYQASFDALHAFGEFRYVVASSGDIMGLVETIRATQWLEVGVYDRLLGRDATGGVVDEKRVEQIESVVIQVGDGGGDVCPVPLGERRLEVGEGRYAGPLLLGGSTQDASQCQLAHGCGGVQEIHIPEDLEDLVDLRITGEQGLASTHFGKNATDRPHVHTSRVLTTTQKNLRGTVPEGNNLV